MDSHYRFRFRPWRHSRRASSGPLCQEILRTRHLPAWAATCRAGRRHLPAGPALGASVEGGSTGLAHREFRALDDPASRPQAVGDRVATAAGSRSATSVTSPARPGAAEPGPEGGRSGRLLRQREHVQRVAAIRRLDLRRDQSTARRAGCRRRAPCATAMYCLPSTAKLIGKPCTEVASRVSHTTRPSRTSTALKLRSRSPANATPPAVDSTRRHETTRAARAPTSPRTCRR